MKPHTECQALNSNKIKHISKMKAGIKLCTSSFDVVNLPVVFSPLGRGHLIEATHSRVLSCFPQVKRCFLWGRRWTAFCGWQCLYPTTMMKNSYWSFLFWRIYSVWWHFSNYDGEYCFISCYCGNSFPVKMVWHLTPSIIFMPFWTGGLLVIW